MAAPGFQEAMFLVYHKVPYETAMHMSARRRKAHVGMLGQLAGLNWNWRKMGFDKAD